MNKTAVIIGAGVGGIATAIYLAKNGYAVKVYEKNPAPGGRCGQIIREGHRFDLGATIFMMPSIYKRMFDSLGISLEHSFQVIPLPIIYKIYFDDGSELAYSNNEKIMQPQLEAVEPGSFKRYRSYVSAGYQMFKIAINTLLGKNFYSLFDFVNFKNIIVIMKIKAYLRHIHYVKRFFKHRHLRMAFTFQNIYVGQNPFKAPALFSMLPAAELTEGSLFLKGGMYSIVEKLISAATNLGVEFYYNQTVNNIVIEKNHAAGIRTDEKDLIPADIIIANADLPYVYRELLPDIKKSKRLDHLKYSCSAIVFHWGLDKTYPQLEHHSVFLSEKYHDNLNKIFRDKSMSEKPSFYVHSPVRSDPSAAPAGEDSLSIVLPAGHLDKKSNADWNKLKLTARTAVIERLVNAGMEDIEKHIKFEICYLPNTWQSIFNISKGSVFGSLGHNIMQMGYFRPHNRHSRYKNLYFVGGSTHPGNGVPLVLLSAKLTSERIMNES